MKNMKLKLLIMLLILAVVSVSCGNNKSGENMNTSKTLNKVPALESKMMIIAKLSVKPEKIREFTEVAKEMIGKSNTESGCSFYQLYQNPFDNSKFVFVEEYNNQAAVDAHFATDYFKAFGPKIGDLIIGAPEIKVISVAKEVIQ